MIASSFALSAAALLELAIVERLQKVKVCLRLASRQKIRAISGRH